MKKALSIISLVLVVAVAGVLAFAAARPNTFQVQRTALVNAPPEKIFPLINDFHAWSAWSPYEKLDPAMQRTYAGGPGNGASYAWSSQGQAGVGRMHITESAPPSKVNLALDFTKPFEAHNQVEFRLEPQGDQTKVTWLMHGPSPLISKIMGLFFDMDTMIGKDFETGLANLKRQAET